MLKRLFNDEIDKLDPKKGIGEVKLFECLERALQSYHSVKTHICHQKYVQTCYRRELCDLFVMIIHNDCIRFSFVQHKYSRNPNYEGLANFEIDCGQHKLLVKKPKFQIVGTPVESELLAKSKYDTVTAYSVFYKDDKGEFDFDFASANSVECRNKNNFYVSGKCGKTATHKYNSMHSYIQTGMKIDFDKHKKISEIENHPDFGEVIDFCNNDDKLFELMRFVSQFNLGDDILNTLKYYNLYSRYKEILNMGDGYYIFNNGESQRDSYYERPQYYVKKMFLIDLNRQYL